MSDIFDDSSDEISRPSSRGLATICKDTMEFTLWTTYFESSNVFVKPFGGKSSAALARLQHLKEVTLPFPPTVAKGHRCYAFYEGIKSNWPVSPEVEDTHDFSTIYPYLGLIWERHRKFKHDTEASFRQFFDNLITTAFEWGEQNTDQIRVENTYPIPDAPRIRQQESTGRFDLAWICRIDNEHFRACQPQENRNLNPFRIGLDHPLILSIIGFLTEFKLNDPPYVRNQVILGLMTCALHLRRLGIRDVAIYGLAVDSSKQKTLWAAIIDRQGRIDLDYADATVVLDEQTPEGALRLYFFMLNMKHHLQETLLPKLEHLKSGDLKNPEFDWVGRSTSSMGDDATLGSWPGDGTSRGDGRSYSWHGTDRKRDYQHTFGPSSPSVSAGEDTDSSLRIPTPIVTTLPTWVNSSAEELDEMLMVPRSLKRRRLVHTESLIHDLESL